MPKVSVITGYHNRGEHLERTVRSILEQTFSDIELIVFDDASTDGTAARLPELAARLNDPRFRYIVHEQNKGFTQGMIDAIAAAKGAYIAVQGSGDISLPTRIERQVEVLERQLDVVAVGCWYTNVVADSGARRPRQPDANNIDFGTLLKGNVYSHGEVMYRRSAYDEVGGYRAAFKNCQDYDLWLRMIRVGRLATVRDQLYDRYVRFDGVSYDPKKFAVQARYFLLAKRIGAMPLAEQEPIVAELKEKGPLALVPKDDKALQKRYAQAALRSIAWGASREAEALARDNIISTPIRLGLISMARLFGTPVGKPLQRLVQRSVGVQ
jgi:glycosyltransferase involved in cell wall biosynthesis